MTLQYGTVGFQRYLALSAFPVIVGTLGVRSFQSREARWQPYPVQRFGESFDFSSLSDQDEAETIVRSNDGLGEISFRGSGLHSPAH